MSKAPAFQFYANDFMDSTRFWEAAAIGLYIQCLCIQWTQGGIPSDTAVLRRGVGMSEPDFEAAWIKVGPKFQDNGAGLLLNGRLEEVRQRQEGISKKRSDSGKAGAIAKASGQANALASNHTNGVAKIKQRKEKEKEKEKEKVEDEKGSEENSESGTDRNSATGIFSSFGITPEEAAAGNPKWSAKDPDWQYYTDKVQDWSDVKGTSIRRSKKQWIATYRTFLRGDEDDGKLRLQRSKKEQPDWTKVDADLKRLPQ